MFARCNFCHADLPTNQTVEHFRVGRRVAFDPGRGRLWVVCQGCRRWNLAPIEERWEALEELERLTRDRGRLLSQTDQIALLRVEDLEVVRVGRAKRVEEAWWRYGQEMQRRRARSHVIAAAEVAAYIGMTALTTVGWFWFGGRPINDLLRWRKFGNTVWRGDQACERCGAPLKAISFKRAKHLALVPDQLGAVTLRLRCKRCGFHSAAGGVTFKGPPAERMLQRVLAYQNFSGANEARVKLAVAVIDDAGSPEALIRRLSAREFRLRSGKRNPESLIALEIAVNDEAERQLLELELAELEARWREEEELAAIVDGELTELPLLDQLRLRLPG
jgi:hypothetical protein